MKILSYLLAPVILNLFFFSPGKSQVTCDTVFTRSYVAAGNIEPFSTRYLSNNEILIAGRGNQSAGSLYHAMATKLSASGAVIWSLLVGGNAEDRFTGITELNDGSYLAHGTTQSFGFTAGKILLVHLSRDGALLWSRQLGTATASKDVLKAIVQCPDGAIVGTFNVADSSDQSDPVVFKMDLNGGLKWARRFDNGTAESFTSIAYESDSVYVAGYYTGVKKTGVIAILSASTGKLLSSQKIYYSEDISNEEVTNLEVYNGKISYALFIDSKIGWDQSGRMILVQADLAGNPTFKTIIQHDSPFPDLFLKRSPDEGFILLPTRPDLSLTPNMLKISRYNQLEWSTLQSDDRYGFNQKNRDFDVTKQGGSVSAGYYNNYFTGGINKMVVVKTTAKGEVGPCTYSGRGFFMDSVSIHHKAHSWTVDTSTAIELNDLITPSVVDFNLTSTRVCDTVFCVDKTALPLVCNKTSLVEYGENGFTILRDAVVTDDGGKIAVGEMGNQAFATKILNNGAVAWAKKLDEFAHNGIFYRVIRSDKNNVLAFANNAYVIDHHAYRSVKVVKLDDNGNVLFTKEITRGYGVELADVFATPDGGFVIMLNENHGLGYLNSGVVRFDKNLQVIWKKEIMHHASTPIYRSVYCTTDAVYIGHDTYDNYNQDKIGIQKLDFATGNNVWSKWLSVENSLVRFNKIISLNDTLYAFINRNGIINASQSDYYVMMLKLTSAGEVINSMLLKGDQVSFPNTYNYIDYANPTVTITTENDFVFSKQVETTAGKALNITRFNTSGQASWSKNFPGLSAHTVFNIHTQDKGFLILGTALRPRTVYPIFYNSFLLKTDSAGEIISNSNGSCAPVNRPFINVPINVSEVDPRIDSVIDLKYFSIEPGSIIEQAITLNVIPSCSQPVNCSDPHLAQSGNGCSMADTLTYFLADNCGAALKWTYDTAFFKQAAAPGDTLKLLPRRTGTSLIEVEIETSCSRTKDRMLAVVLVSAAKLDLGRDTIICPKNSLTLKAGSGYKTYRWNDGSTDSNMVVRVPGMYYVTVTDNCGGRSSDSVLVSPIAASFEITGRKFKCNNDTLVLTASAGYFNYKWAPAASLQGIINTAVVNPQRTTRYFVEAEKFAGCMVTDSFDVTVATSPRVDLGRDTVICYGAVLKLNSPGVFESYQWNDGSNASSILVNQPGVYFIVATYSNSCISMDTIVIKQHAMVKPQLGSDTSLCSGSGFNLFAGNYAAYEWNIPGVIRSSIPVTKPGQYSVRVVDQFGCNGSDTIRILNLYDPPANFLKDSAAVCAGDMVVLGPATGFSNYEWSNGSYNNSITTSQPGVYFLAAMDSQGCRGTDTIRVVRKQDCPATIFFTTAFTPNRDGRNEIFKPTVTGNLQKFVFTIYNRYGQILFVSNNPATGWDGIYQNKLQPQGGYIFTCDYQFINGAPMVKKGSFILVR